MDNSPLVLEDAGFETWSRFIEAPLRGHELVSSALLRSWSRAIGAGVSPNGVDPATYLIRGPALNERLERIGALLRSSEQVLQDTARALSDRDFITLLSDADGVVVRSLGGGDFEETARNVLLIEGAGWAESIRGTNAIGTAIAEGRSVAVHGQAHFERPVHGLVCYASPIRDPYGEILAVLDATSYSSATDPFVHHAVATAARAIEEILRLQTYAGVGPGVLQTLEHTLDRIHEPALLVEAPGHIRQVNAHTRQYHAHLTRHRLIHDALPLSWQDLLAEVRRPTAGGRPITLPHSGEHRLKVEPIFGHEGRLLAALVILGVPPSSASLVSTGELSGAPSREPFSRIFSADTAVSKAVDTARRVARSDLPVMLLAESGTGKELFAQAIHGASRRKDGPFIALNCGALSPQLLESELFGYAPNSFTGADRRGRDGQLMAADGGTLFLDEVAEMPQTMQAMLLRVLETGRFNRVGETREQQVNIRLICATCANLPEMVAQRRFRNDLYYRLKGISLSLPPLRERADIIPLARHLLAQLCHEEQIAPTPQLSPDLQAWLQRFPWHGNVRELRTTLHCTLVMAGGAPTLSQDHLPPGMSLPTSATTSGRSTVQATRPLDAVEGEAVKQALQEANGNVSQAARTLGVARSTLYRMMKRHGLLE